MSERNDEQASERAGFARCLFGAAVLPLAGCRSGGPANSMRHRLQPGRRPEAACGALPGYGPFGSGYRGCAG